MFYKAKSHKQVKSLGKLQLSCFSVRVIKNVLKQILFFILNMWKYVFICVSADVVVELCGRLK